MWPELAKFCHFGQILKVLDNFSRVYFNFFPNFDPTLGIFCGCWAYFRYIKWPNIGTLISPSGHTVTNLSDFMTSRHLHERLFWVTSFNVYLDEGIIKSQKSFFAFRWFQFHFEKALEVCLHVHFGAFRSRFSAFLNSAIARDTFCNNFGLCVILAFCFENAPLPLVHFK